MSTKNILDFFGVSSNKLEDRIKSTIKEAIEEHLPAAVGNRTVRLETRSYVQRKVQLLLDEELKTAECVCLCDLDRIDWTFLVRIYLSNSYDSTYKCIVGLSGISDVEIKYETSMTGAGSAWE